MRVYRGRGLGDIYYELIRDISQKGREITVRGKQCLELPEPVTIIYDRPGYFLMDIPGRKFNPFFAMAEVPWILSGNGNVDWISFFNSNMRSFSDGGEEFHGSYGKRIFRYPSTTLTYATIDQVAMVVNKLKKDPFSRQAVICIWDVEKDNLIKTNDIPCNNLVYYSLREGKLNQTVTIRSNDLIWGTPHNAIQYSGLHARVAGALEVEMGTFTYVINNLHYYLHEYKTTLASLITAAFDETAPIEALKAEGFCPITDSILKSMCSSVEEALETHGDSVLLDESRHFVGGNLWERTIPLLIGIYAHLRNAKSIEPFKTKADYLDVKNLAYSLPDTFVQLIIDFYRDSIVPMQSTLADELLKSRGKNGQRGEENGNPH